MTRPRVLLTGGSGLLATNWACAIRTEWEVVLGTHLHPVELEGTACCQLDLGDQARLLAQIGQVAPDLIVNAVGLTDVDRCEADPELATHVNAQLACNVATVASLTGCKLIHVSTDHLFAGDRQLCSESDIPCPLNEYARSKLLGEALVQKVCPGALVVRTNFFGWGHAGRQSFSDWILASLRAGKSIPLFDDVHFTPILADALALTAHKLAEGGASGIFNITGDDRVSKYAFGQQLAKRFELPAELIQHGQMGLAQLRATRPIDMSLANAKTRSYVGASLGSLDCYFNDLHLQERQGRRMELLRAVGEASGLAE
jgi:dTDP-4-dehydrorhamnose reductase